MKIWKKTMSLLITMVLTFVVVGFIPQTNVDATTTSRTYYVYNAITGVRLTSRDYTLNPLSIPSGSGSSGTNSVIGTDDRVIDYTKSGVVKLLSSTGYRGSGFVVDDHTIATAAHCIANTVNAGKTLSEILLFSSNGSISLHATPIEYHIPALFYTFGGCSAYDYALITVEEDLSSYSCFYLGAVLDGFLTSGAALSVTGFPQYLNDDETKTINSHDVHAMYTGTGSVVTVTSGDPGKVYYNADSSGGNSGGPTYITTAYYGTVYYTVIAVHTTSGGSNNSGTRITSDLLHFYLNNSNIVYNVSSS